MTAKDELAKLKREVEELKAKLSPPKSEPFVSEPFQRYDPTAGMSMPRSTMLEMAAAVPDHMLRDIALRDTRAPTGPSAQGAIPSSQQVSNVRGGGGVPGGGTGWAHSVPLTAADSDRKSLAERCAPYGKGDLK